MQEVACYRRLGPPFPLETADLSSRGPACHDPFHAPALSTFACYRIDDRQGPFAEAQQVSLQLRMFQARDGYA